MSEPRTTLNPTAIPPADAAQLFTRLAGQPVTVEMLDADRDAGAPRNADGTINLICYAAWLAKSMHQAES